MGYESNFLPNKIYGATDINNRLKKYVTSGVADPFVNGVPYNAGKLNDLTSALVNAGVVPSSDLGCKAIIDTTATTVTILKGVCFFNNGTSIEIDSAGVVLPYTTGVKNYVYVKSDLATNDISPHCTTTEPIGDYVMLAEITAAEEIIDRRQYAKGKIPGYESDFNHSAKKTITETLPQGSTSKSYDFEGNVFENFAFVLWEAHSGGGGSRGGGISIYSGGNYWSIWSSDSSYDDRTRVTDRVVLWYLYRGNEISLKVRIEDGVIWFDYNVFTARTITFDVYAF